MFEIIAQNQDLVLVERNVINLLQGSVFLNVLFFGLFMWLFLIFIPIEAKHLIVAKIKHTGALLFKMDNSGAFYFENVEADKNEGVLIGKDSRTKSKKMYYFLPKIINWKDAKEGEKDKVDTYNDILKYRGILPGIKKPVYLASTATHIGSPPKLIEEINKSKQNQKLNDTSKKLSFKDWLKTKMGFSNDEIDKIEAEILVPLSIDELNEMAGTSWSVEDIKAAEDEGYLIGLGLNPPKIPGWVIPIGVIAFIAVLIMILGRANINLGFLGL